VRPGLKIAAIMQPPVSGFLNITPEPDSQQCWNSKHFLGGGAWVEILGFDSPNQFPGPITVPRSMSYKPAVLLKVRPMNIKVGRKWNQSLGLRLWRWVVFSFFTSPSSYISHISVSSQYSPLYRQVLEHR
jgi:hypothetical protein